MSDWDVLYLITGLAVPFWTLAATLCFWLMRRPWRRAKRYMRRGGVAEGVVVGHEGRGSSAAGSPSAAEVVEYRDPANRVFRAVSKGGSSFCRPVGARMQVAYDPDNPGDGLVLRSEKVLALAGTLLSVLFGLFAVVSAAVFGLLRFVLF